MVTPNAHYHAYHTCQKGYEGQQALKHFQDRLFCHYSEGHLYLIWGRVLPLIRGKLATYVEDYVEYHPDSSEEEWIWMGRQLQDDHMQRQDLSGGSYGMAFNNILLL